MNAAKLRPDCTFFGLTKRASRMAQACHDFIVPKNFWLGVTIESQKRINRILSFKNIDAIRVVSFKPLLSEINLRPYKELMDMVIVGGEYNYNNLDWSRPMSLNWVRSIRDQCLEMNIPFSFHNWGSWVPCNNGDRFDKIFHGFPMRYHNNESSDPYLLDGKIWDEYPDHC